MRFGYLYPHRPTDQLLGTVKIHHLIAAQASEKLVCSAAC